MSSISSVKESFALAGCDITAREKVIAQTLVVGTDFWYYYRGLVLLQKLLAALSGTTTIRSPTEQERDLLIDLEQHVSEYKNRFSNATRSTELETRFYLMTWFINNDKCKRYIQNSLNLNLPVAQQQIQTNIDNNNNYDNKPMPSFQSTSQHQMFDTATEKTYPSSLDTSFLNPNRLFRQLVDNNQLDRLNTKAWPILHQHWHQLDSHHKTMVLKKFLRRPVSTQGTDGTPIVEYLLNLWQPPMEIFGRQRPLKELVAEIPLENLSLEQLDELQTAIPSLLRIAYFVNTYLEKLVPYSQDGGSAFMANQSWWNEWEDDDNDTAATGDGSSTWTQYLETLDRFADKLLDGPFRLVKARITYQRLRSDLLHNVFDPSLLLAYLSQSQSRNKFNNGFGFEVATPTPKPLFSSGSSQSSTNIVIPLLGSCDIPIPERTKVINEYLTGLIRTQNLESLDMFGVYLDQKTYLDPLLAKVMLTSGLAKMDDITNWSNMLSSAAFSELAAETTLTFGLSTIHNVHSRKLTQDDVIPIQVTIKNIPRLTIRIFPIDLFNYWKLHPSDMTIKDGNKLNVDGLCPVYEHQLEYSDVLPLHLINETFIFGGTDGDSHGGKSIATELFQDRGAWMIDFIGGQNQCRAIVQKGYLRHIMQNTAAGHLFLIMDEKNQPMGDACSIWFENGSYQTDEVGNILIPYRSKGSKKVRALFMVKSGYCQPIEFYHQEERYSLDAIFYLNCESLVPTKQAKVVITPTLKLQDQVLPLQLLKKLSLQIITTNSSNVKSSISINDLKVEKGKPLECEFIVPKFLRSIKLTLSGKVETMSKDEPWKHLESTRNMQDNGSVQDEITSTHMRTGTSGYYICVIGKNGEPHRRCVVDISFGHTLALSNFDMTMQTDENGHITLGTLDQIESVTIKQLGKTWNLLGDNWESIGNYDEVALPSTIQYYANTKFEIPFARVNGCHCTLFKTGYRGTLIADYTNRLKYTDSSVMVVDGLPEGSYCFYLTRIHQQVDTKIKVTIIKDSKTQQTLAASEKKDVFWNDWVIDNQIYGKTSGDIIKQPLGIENINITNDTMTLKLKNASTSGPTFAIATTSAFLSTVSDSLSNSQIKDANGECLWTKSLHQNGMEHIYLTGRKLGEEYQYILNRAKEDKYLGSTLTEPTLLVNPKKNKTTTVESRTTGTGNRGFTSETNQRNSNTSLFGSGGGGGFKVGYSGGNSSAYTNFDFGFLNHNAGTLVLQANHQGEVVIDRSRLGDGNILQVVVFSGEQAVGRTLVLRDVKMDLKLNDQRQTDQDLDVNAAYLRNKLITVLSPSHSQHSLEIDQTQHESEFVDSQEALLDIFKLLAPNQSKELADFNILRQWGTMNEDEKLKAHNEMNSHELNLWIKCKDATYFEDNIKPFIKGKINKTFMDNYLIDEDLTNYANDLYLFQQLNLMEKALLAKRVPQILPVVLRLFKDNYTKNLSDLPFDTVLTGNSLSIPDPQSSFASSSVHQYSRPPPPPPPPSAPSAGHFGSTGQAQPVSLFGSSQPSAGPGSIQPHGFGSFGAPRFAQQSMPSTQPATSLFGASVAPASVAPPPPPPPPIGFGAPAQPISSTPASSVNVAHDMEIKVIHNTDNEENDIYDDDDDDNRDNEIDTIMGLRVQAAKRRQAQLPYDYMEQTMEYEEREYYDQMLGMINVNQFWIDYLENNLDIFVSANVIYATTSIAEMVFALALLDLPIKSDVNYDMISDLTTGKITISATTPLMVFYRSLKKYTQQVVAQSTLLLGHHIFEQQKNSSDEEHIVEPSQLLVHTPYGWHLAISNISTKAVTCEVTLQIPTGAVPLGETPYCQSKNIMIKPYTTWHEIVGSFYFPEHGTFYQFPVTVGEQQKIQTENNIKSESIGNTFTTTMVLLNQTQPLELLVNEMDEKKKPSEQNCIQKSTAPLSAYASWPVVNSTGTANDILDFIENHGDKLKSLDWSLVMWRMTNYAFARTLLTLLARQKYYNKSIYAYGIYHGFNDIIVDLLVQERFSLLQKTGIVFDSPLVKWCAYGDSHHKIRDYYPMLNARVHPLGSSQGIANLEFFKHYDMFLTYMNESVQRSVNDYLTLSIYLILHGRIGEAREVHCQSQQILNEGDDDKATTTTTSVQADYLASYLATRIKVGEKVDWSTVKNMVAKYKTCGSLRWRNLFARLNELVVQVENCDLQVMEHDDSTIAVKTKASLGTDPVFDFTIKNKQVVVRYANLTEMQVRFYNINVEVMFSNQPFLNKVNKMSDYGWVQANHMESINLLDEQSDNSIVMMDNTYNDDDDDFGWIGVSKVRQRRYTFPIPLIGNLLVEIHAHGKTQCQTHYNHALTIHLSEQIGLTRVLEASSLEHHQQKPLSGVYCKVYAKLENGRVEFWKDGYTGLTGVFDYISITHGNALAGPTSLEKVVKRIKKFALLFSSELHGAVVKEVGIPL